MSVNRELILLNFQIDTGAGQTILGFKLHHKYVGKIQVNNGYVYYLYRPFESLDKKALYREAIGNDQAKM